MIRTRLALILSLIATPAICAAEKLPPELAVIPGDAAVFVSVRCDLLAKSSVGRAMLEVEGVKPTMEWAEKHWFGFPISEVERATLVFPRFTDRASVNVPVLIVTRNRKIDRALTLRTLNARSALPERIVPHEPREDRTTRRGELWRIENGGGLTPVLMFLGDRSLVLGLGESDQAPELGVLHMLGQLVDISGDGPLNAAIEHAARNNVLAVGVSTDFLKPMLKAIDGKEKLYAALGAAKSATLVVSLEPDFQVSLRVEFPDEAAARSAQPVAIKLAAWLDEFVKTETADTSNEELKLVAILLESLKSAGEPRVDGKALTLNVRINGNEFAKVAVSAIKAGRARLISTLDQRKSANALKQLALAVHNFSDVNDFLPFKERPKDEIHPGLSWRVALLPLRRRRWALPAVFPESTLG
jgi:hypothetical protein